MKNYTSDTPVWSDTIPVVEQNDLVNAENDSAAAKQLLQNILVLAATKVNKEDGKSLVSEAERNLWNMIYEQATGYTDQKIAGLINGAPSTLDTLGEIAAAMGENADVVEALELAIGTKANQAEMESLLGTKLDKTGDTKDNTITFASSDTTTPSGWSDVAVLTSGETHKSFVQKVSTMFKNMRYLWKLCGSTDISKIGNGTITGALNELNMGLAGKAASIHDHDSRYYTEDEIDSRLIKQNYFKSSDIVWLGITIVTLRYGKSVTLHTFSGTLSADLTAYQKYTIGQMQSEYRPAYQITKIINIQGDVTAMLNILPGGAVELTPYAVLHRGYVPLIFETYMLK